MSLTLKIIGKNYFLLNQYNLHFDNIFTINITYKANIFKVSVIIFNVYIAQFLCIYSFPLWFTIGYRI